MLSTDRNRENKYWKIIEGRFYRSLPVIFLPVVLAGCGTTSHLVDISYLHDYRVKQIDAPDPSLDGPYSYRTYFYGSGDDKHRKEYGQGVNFKTDPVDARPFVDILDEMPRYWGFSFDSLPLNGRVWFPDGNGPFPLVLIVHGNHNMKDFSDTGYEYLGKLLAGRGFIAVSVDENFLNQKFCDENDARAFVLMEHLNLWDTWNNTEGHAFEGMVDMDRIALIGHSRGGESVAHAAAFNRLERYPDDANIRLDYNFDIRSIIAIAPCDGQYKPAGHPTALENVNYLVIQGGHDADVATFMGLRQFNRVYFTDDHFWFKSAIYVYRANHNQFNTAWGRLNASGPESWLINDKPIMDTESQRKVAKVLISAFLEATLNNRDEYLPMFKDIRKAGQWLPEDIYINRYEDSNFIIIADFEEDFDVTTTTIPGGRMHGENLKTWKEAHVPYRTKDGSNQENSTVVLEWDNEKEKDPNSSRGGSQTAPTISYTVMLNPEVVKELDLNRNMSIVFSIGAENEDQNEPLDLTIELCDDGGNCTVLPLNSIGPIHPALIVRLAKWKWLERKFIEEFSERILQTYEIPIHSFIENNSLLEPSRLRSIRFIFDRSDKGCIMLDDIGFS
jgi:dienelactone hydrolase